MKPYQILMAVALLAAGALVLFGDRTPDSGIAEPVQRTRSVASPAVATGAGGASGTLGSAAGSAPLAGKTSAGKAPSDVAILRLTPRSALVGVAAEASFAAGEAIFRGHSWNPPPPPPPPVSNAPPPPPMAPPVPFTVIGKALADGAWEVYLARADKTYVARPQTIIEGSYRVEKITPPSMLITYLPLNQVQQIYIGALD